MEGNDWRTAQSGEQSMDPSATSGGAVVDWRSQLPQESRHRIVNKIMETLKRHLPFSGPEGMIELKKISVRFEEKIYTAATSQTDYLRKISLKMLTMETKTQNPGGANPLPPNASSGSQNPPDPASHVMQQQARNQAQSIPIPLANQSQARQQILPQTLQNPIASANVQGSTSMPPVLPSMTGLTQPTVSNIGQTSGLQNISGISQNTVNNPLGQGTMSNMLNTQRPISGRHAQQAIAQQQQQSQNSHLGYPQMQHQLMKQNLHNSSLLQSQIQQQQSLLQQTQMQSSQQPLVQMSSGLQSSQPIQQAQSSMMQSVSQPSFQQNQQNIVQQSTTSLIQQHQQSMIRKQQQSQPSSVHQQAAGLQQQPTPISQQATMSSQQQQQQQQQLLGQQSNMTNMQQNQLLGQQNSIPDMQQHHIVQQRLSGQQNNLVSMQQSQQMLAQSNITNLQQQQQLVGQNNISGVQQQQHQQQQQQSQQLLGTQPNVANMQQHQHSMLQQAKATAQQQLNQQSAPALLPSQGQHSQTQQSQQQLMSQLQSQPAQLQQQLAMQQQTNSLQRDLQQRMQASSALLQPQNAMEQQKQMLQSQRAHPEASSTSMDSTAQTGNVGGIDWQEEAYQKVKSLKEMYLSELNDFFQKLALKLQQNEAYMQPGKHMEQYDKLKNYKTAVERIISVLQLSKNQLQPGIKEKLVLCEKQIVGLLTSNRRRPPNLLQQGQQFQQPGGQSHSMSQQLQSQVSQLQQHDNHVNQSVNLQGSVTSMQSAVVSGMQHGSMPLSTSHLGVPTTQQSMMNAIHSGSNLDSVQGNALSSMQPGSIGSAQQGGVGPISQNTIHASQQSNINTLSHSNLNSLQSNVSSLPSNNILQHQQLKQQQEQQMKQLQQHQLQQQIILQQQKHQMMQHQQQQQQQQPQIQQQLHQQQKPQQSAQLQGQQIPQLHQISELNELKVRPATGVKAGIFPQHHPAGQRQSYYHQPLRTGSSFPISSPQNLQAPSPQISQHSSPQIDQQGMLSTLPKAGTPLQSSNSPFIVPSPSTPAPSPVPGEPEKQLSSITSLSNARSIGHQQAAHILPQAQSLAVGTPGISASPLLAEFTNVDGNQGNASTMLGGRSNAKEQPIDRLLKAIQSLSPQALSSSISDIGSVVSMVDRIAGSAPGNGSRAAVGEDLVAMTKCRLQARNFIPQDGTSATKKIKRHTSAMPLNAVSSAGSVNDNFRQANSEISELESTATSKINKQRAESNHALLEEIREINKRLINTVVDISDGDADSVTTAAAEGEGTVVKCSYTAVALSPRLKSQYMSSQISPISPLRLLVPANYPNCSPILLDQLPVEMSKEPEDLPSKTKSRFSISLRGLSQPMSVGEMVRTWDKCVRMVITEYAQQNGGGSFSSRYGTWENIMTPV